MISDFEKRMIMAMQYGFRIESADGHRWLFHDDCDYLEKETLTRELTNKGYYSFNYKVYGTYEEALDLIDHILKIIDRKSLLDSYWAEEEEIKGSYESNKNWVEKRMFKIKSFKDL